jgi:MFS transporter, PHS family, inorganic phosphate transporter
LSALNSDHTLLQKTLTQLGIFAIFAAPGYAVAAFTMDRLGGKTIQSLGFGMMAVRFPRACPDSQPSENGGPLPHHLRTELLLYRLRPQRNYLRLSLRGVPGPVRTTGHGIAAIGKLGGFFGVFFFPYLLNWKGLLGAELAAASASVLGLLVTLTMLPETKGKSLEEIEAGHTPAFTPAERLAA